MDNQNTIVQPVTVGVISLGCSKNRVDTEQMLFYLQQSGYVLCSDPALSQVIIVNTCGFIESARQEAVDTLLKMAQYKRYGQCRALIATGCMVERYARDLAKAMPEIDAFLGVWQYAQIDQAIQAALQGDRPIFCQKPEGGLRAGRRILTTPPYMAYLKIAEGCDNRCAYCAIPGIRGGYESIPMEQLLDQAHELVSRGVRELVVVAQDTTYYGEDKGEKGMLAELLNCLCDIPDLVWIRLLYAYPHRVDSVLLDVICRQEKICKYLDIPIQHFHADTLQRMNRHGSPEQIASLVEQVRFIGGFTLRTTVMVGYPGETDQEYQTLYDYLRDHPFDRVGVFCFSPEEGTAAEHMTPRVKKQVASQRRNALMVMLEQSSKQLLAQRIGKTCLVLCEGCDEKGRYWGRSQWEAPEVDGKIYFNADRRIEPGDFVPVLITGAAAYDLMGEYIDESCQ